MAAKALISSTIVKEEVQADGRTYVTEEFVDAIGKIHRIEYLATPLTDKNAVLLTHGSELEEYLADTEFRNIINGN